MNLKDLKRMAIEADPIEIQWEMFEKHKDYADDFIRAITSVTAHIEDLELLHTKITSNQSVLFEGMDSPLNYHEKEDILEMIEGELVAGYQLRDLHDRYITIRSITE